MSSAPGLALRSLLLLLPDDDDDDDDEFWVVWQFLQK